MKHDQQKGSLRYFWLVYVFLCALAIFYLGGLGLAAEAERQGDATALGQEQIPSENRTGSATGLEGKGAPTEIRSRHAPAERTQHIIFKREKRSLTAATFRVVILLIFFLMLFTPFIPGIIELYWPKDNLPLYVDLNFIKDPRYFGKSFRNLIHNAVNPANGLTTVMEMQNNGKNGTLTMKLSKEEAVEICGDRRVESKEQAPNVLFVKGNLLVEENGVLLKEAKVFGNSQFLAGSELRAVACDGDITLEPQVQVRRWIDAEGNILAGEQTNLGFVASSENILTMDRKCRFRRLFANPIQTYSNGSAASEKKTMNLDLKPTSPGEFPRRERETDTIEDELKYVKHDLTVKSDEVIAEDLIVRGDLVAREGAVFEGTIKVHGKAVFEKDVLIRGSVFAEQSIRLADNCTVLGNLFCQGNIHIGRGCRIGQAGKIKSVIGKKEILLSEDVVIHGYVLTEGEGKVL